MLKAERISCSDPKLSDAQTCNFEAIKHSQPTRGDPESQPLRAVSETSPDSRANLPGAIPDSLKSSTIACLSPSRYTRTSVPDATGVQLFVRTPSACLIPLKPSFRGQKCRFGREKPGEA